MKKNFHPKKENEPGNQISAAEEIPIPIQIPIPTQVLKAQDLQNPLRKQTTWEATDTEG